MGPMYVVLSAKNVSSSIHIWELYMAKCFPYMLFYIGKAVVSHLPLFSYLGAVSFLNLQFENYFNILDICVFN